LLQWEGFTDRWRALTSQVTALQAADSTGYHEHQAARFLASLHKLVTETIPADPANPAYRLGTTMGDDAKFWRRAKLHGRYRLFFRYHSEQKVILYAWLNDENTLRKAGARSDPYAVFRQMIESGKPPSNWDELLAACTPFAAAGMASTNEGTTA
jgi:toxin YhaV